MADVKDLEGLVLKGEMTITEFACAKVDASIERMKERNPDIRIIGLQPAAGASIPGIRRWSGEYLPRIFEPARVDEVLDVGQHEAESTMRTLAREEGILCGVSSGGAVAGALRVADATRGAVIVAIVCDRGDRYLSTGVFPI